MSKKPRNGTPGLIRALAKGRNRSACKACGFPMPVYPGKYPLKCPMCEAPREEKNAES